MTISRRRAKGIFPVCKQFSKPTRTPTNHTPNDRKHLVSAEVDKLIEATKSSRNAARDRCFLLLMFRHGLRVSEACGLTLSLVDIESRILHVARLKKGLSTTHPICADEIKAIKSWLTIRAKMKPKTDAFFISELSAKVPPLSQNRYFSADGVSSSWEREGIDPQNGPVPG